MKKKMFLLFILSFIFVGVVKAEEFISTFTPTGITGKVDVVKPNDVGSYLDMNFVGSPMDEYEGKPLHGAYAYFVSNPGTPFNTSLLTTDSSGCKYSLSTDQDDFSKVKSVNYLSSTANKAGHVLITDAWNMYSGYEYAYLILAYKDTDNKYYCKYSNTTIKFEKPVLPAKDKMYQYYLFGNTTSTDMKNTFSIFHLYPSDNDLGLNMHTKIGRITDFELIKQLKSNYSAGLNELLSFAKADVNQLTLLNYLDKDHFDMEATPIDVVEGGLYYVYTYYDNTNGTLRDLDGISIVQGKSGMLITEIDYSIYDDSEHSAADPVDPTTPTGPVDNPVTGLTIGIGAVLVLGAFVLLLSKSSKRKFYKI